MNEELPRCGKLYPANHPGCAHWAPIVPPAVDPPAEAKTVTPAEAPDLPGSPAAASAQAAALTR